MTGQSRIGWDGMGGEGRRGARQDRVGQDGAVQDRLQGRLVAPYTSYTR